MDGAISAQGKELEQEVMNILVGSSLFAEMSASEREKLLRYLVSSYYRPRVGGNCRAQLKAVRTSPVMS